MSLVMMLGVQCSASYLLTLRAKKFITANFFLHYINSKVFAKSTLAKVKVSKRCSLDTSLAQY